jgi:hypothetical protein
VNLLGAKLYDPTTAATFGTVASAMAVFDTTNLRIPFVVPPSGFVRVVIEVTIHGAATYSQILLGVMNGAAVTAKVCPDVAQNGTALATTLLRARADFVVPGLSPGASLTWDAAWGIETFVASSLIKYGGPANATANNDFGAAQFEIWDPAPIFTPTSGTAPTTTVSARVDSIKTKTDFLPSATAGAAGGVFIAGTNAATTITTSLTTTFTGNLTGSVGSVTGAVGSVTGNVGGNVTGSVGSVTGLTAANLDVAVSTRLATSGYTVPPTVGAIRSEIDTNSTGLAAIFARTDVATSTRLATAGYTAPDNASITSIKAKTDSLNFTIPGYADASLYYIKGIALVGDGSATPFNV